jgi:hypothetical protein
METSVPCLSAGGNGDFRADDNQADTIAADALNRAARLSARAG